MNNELGCTPRGLAFQRGSKYPSVEVLGPKYYTFMAFGTLCHSVWVLGASGFCRVRHESWGCTPSLGTSHARTHSGDLWKISGMQTGQAALTSNQQIQRLFNCSFSLYSLGWSHPLGVSKHQGALLQTPQTVGLFF